MELNRCLLDFVGTVLYRMNSEKIIAERLRVSGDNGKRKTFFETYNVCRINHVVCY